MPSEIRLPKAVIIIPARLASSRLPRKLLLSETGRPLLQHTYDSARRSKLASKVIVATEDVEIAEAVAGFGGTAVLTGRHPTGTDRVAEAARLTSSADIVVNVQGDEPDVRPDAIDLAIQLLIEDREAVMSTLAAPIRSQSLLTDPSCVKVVCDGRSRAIIFSRSLIPFDRDRTRDWLQAEPPIYLQHVGLYAYRSEFLQKLSAMPQVDLEIVESLEQLRVLHAGYAIRVGIVSHFGKGIDTEADYRAFVSRRTT